MKKSTILSILGFGSIIVAALGFYLAGKYILPDIFGEVNLENEAEKAVLGESVLGKKAPAFSLPDINGDRKILAQFFGVPTVVVFWSTWSPESTNQLKILDDYKRNVSEQAILVHLVSINSQEDPSIASSFIKRGGYGTVALVDVFGDVSNLYNVKSLPTSHFITRDGVVEDIYTGVISERLFVEKVDNLIRIGSVQ
jgi:peroxiredoxin